MAAAEPGCLTQMPGAALAALPSLSKGIPPTPAVIVVLEVQMGQSPWGQAVSLCGPTSYMVISTKCPSSGPQTGALTALLGCRHQHTKA